MRLLWTVLLVVALGGGMPKHLMSGLREDAEVRAMWVVRFTITLPEAIRLLIDQAKRYGYNTLIVQVRGRGAAFYNNGLEPRSPTARLRKSKGCANWKPEGSCCFPMAGSRRMAKMRII